MQLRWRPLTPTDIPAVSAIAAAVHPGFPEADAVFADRQSLAPQSCFLLVDESGANHGYVLAHPYRRGGAPALDTVLGVLPQSCDTLYIHDLALMPSARSSGAAKTILERLWAVAAPFGQISLIAVNGSVPFWTRMGFDVLDVPHLSDKLSSYEPGARYMIRTNVAENPV